MEVESNFLSQQEQNSSNRARLVGMLKQVLHDLNNHKICTLSGENMLNFLFKDVYVFIWQTLFISLHVLLLMEGFSIFFKHCTEYSF